MTSNPVAGIKDQLSYEPAFKKQRVKILAGILNSFHYKFDDKEMLTTLIDKLLFRLAKVGNSKVDEESVDIALFVPILKILQVVIHYFLSSLLKIIKNACKQSKSMAFLAGIQS